MLLLLLSVIFKVLEAYKVCFVNNGHFLDSLVVVVAVFDDEIFVFVNVYYVVVVVRFFLW